MSNPPKQKGTKYETSLLSRFLVRVWPNIRRAEAGNKSNDFTGPFPIEAKKRKTWQIPSWTRTLDEMSPGLWMLMCGPGDSRKADAPPEITVMPTEMAIRLLHYYSERMFESTDGHDEWKRSFVKSDDYMEDLF